MLRQLETAVIKEVKGETGASFLKDNACPLLEKHHAAPSSCQADAAKAVAPAAEKTLPKNRQEPDQLGELKTYRGGNGERVTLAPIQGSALFLVRYEGIEGPWNGKTILFKREDRGNGSSTYWTQFNGSRWNGVLDRNGWKAFAPGYKPGDGFGIGYSDKATKETDAKALLEAYQP